VLLDLRGKTLLADFFLICAGFNNIHIKAIAERVREEADERRLPSPRTEGEQVGEWVLLDFGDVILHIMTEEARARYKLEEYWTTPQPKGALPPTPSSAGSNGSATYVSNGETALFDDLDEDEDEEDEDATFFGDADTEVEPIEEDDEDFGTEKPEDEEYEGEVSDEDLEDYEEGSEEQDTLDDYDEPEDVVTTPPLAQIAPNKDEGATFASFDEKKKPR
jgi:ribosome-associated protein